MEKSHSKNILKLKGADYLGLHRLTTCRSKFTTLSPILCYLFYLYVESCSWTIVFGNPSAAVSCRVV